MRLQWKYSLIINLTVIAVLVAFYFFYTFRLRKEMGEQYVFGAEQGTILKKVVENRIRDAVVSEITTSQNFNLERIDQLLFNLIQDPNIKDVLNIQVALGNKGVRSSLLTQEEATFFLDEEDMEHIERAGSKIDTMDGQDVITVVTKYTIPPKELIPPTSDLNTPSTLEELSPEVWRMLMSSNMNFTIEEIKPEFDFQKAQITLNNGKFSAELWGMFISNEIIPSPDSTIKTDVENNRWIITDSENDDIYHLWLKDRTYWIHIGPSNTGYIRAFFDVPYIKESIRSSLLTYAIFILIVGVLLVVLIDLMTNHLIMKPLERMTDIIQKAESGDLLNMYHRRYGSDEIGKATRNLVRMFVQLKTSHTRRIAALGQFAAGVAHEIRNPLNSIGMTAQHLKNIFSQPNVSPEDIEEAKEFLDIVDNKIAELRQTSEQFLTLNRPQKLNLESVNLNTLLETVISEFVLIAEEAKIQIISNYDSDLPDMNLDEVLMRQTIFNFIQNSIQAIPKGGSIYITTTIEEMDGNELAVLEIRDTGIGIPEENQERIYDAYFTTKETDGGVGLGLSISHQIISAHQGKVEVKSQIGMGTAFKILLPIIRTVDNAYTEIIEDNEE